MPIQIKYVDQDRGVEYVHSGIVTGADIIDANNRIYSNENFKKQRYQIIDRRNCDKFIVSDDEIRIVAEQDKAAAKINPNIILALISVSNLQYGISRMYQAYIGEDGFETEIFQDRESAERWIVSKLKISGSDIGNSDQN